MQPIWKLYGNGCVGSQALLGIPRLAFLRNDDTLAPVSRVWPFEIGLVKLPPRAKRDYRIIYAEIYPSLLSIQRAIGEVKDAAQVKTMAGHFAALDDVGELSTLFAGPSHLSPEMRKTIEFEEGWALGVASGRLR
jgi:precorrin-8X/cobalt-precorrin-8 methylmutase